LREDVYNQLQQSQPLLPGKAQLIFYDHLKLGLILLGAALVVLGLIVFCWSPSDAQRAMQSAPARSPASRAVRIFLSLGFAALLLLFLGALVVGVSFHPSVETKIGTPAPGFQYQLNAPSGGAGRGEIFVTPGSVRVRAAPVLPKQPIAKPPVVQPPVAPAPSTEPAQPDEPDGVFNQ
jgi:hypothetical protein